MPQNRELGCGDNEVIPMGHWAQMSQDAEYMSQYTTQLRCSLSNYILMVTDILWIITILVPLLIYQS